MALQPLAQQDFINLIISYLPDLWVSPEELQPDKQKLTYAIIRGLGSSDSLTYDQLLTLQSALNLTSCVGTQIEDWFEDYFGEQLPRFANETDPQYKMRGILRLFAPVSTRAGMVSVIQQALGTTVIVQEKAEANLTGGYLGGNKVFNSYGGGGYGTLGAGYGQLGLGNAGTPGVGAFGSTNTFDATNVGPLAYGVAGHYGWNNGYGLNSYEALLTIQQPETTDPGFLTKIQIFALVDSLKPFGTTMWIRLLGPASTGGVPV